jgi:hypothetical protein
MTVIPKPEARSNFTVKGWGKRRGEPALIYNIPNNKNPKRHNEKGITESEWRRAYIQLMKTGYFTTKWFKENLSDCAEEGSCNFTTIGGIFEELGLAEYSCRGRYKKI